VQLLAQWTWPVTGLIQRYSTRALWDGMALFIWLIISAVDDDEMTE
jgi:hypothetical protein